MVTKHKLLYRFYLVGCQEQETRQNSSLGRKALALLFSDDDFSTKCHFADFYFKKILGDCSK